MTAANQFALSAIFENQATPSLTNCLILSCSMSQINENITRFKVNDSSQPICAVCYFRKSSNPLSWCEKESFRAQLSWSSSDQPRYRSAHSNARSPRERRPQRQRREGCQSADREHRPARRGVPAHRHPREPLVAHHAVRFQRKSTSIL